MWHFGVGQDLVKQAGDHVDHHVVQRTAAGLTQRVAVGQDLVARHRLATAVDGIEPGLGGGLAGPAGAVVATLSTAAALIPRAGQAADQRHHLAVHMAQRGGRHGGRAVRKDAPVGRRKATGPGACAGVCAGVRAGAVCAASERGRVAVGRGASAGLTSAVLCISAQATVL